MRLPVKPVQDLHKRARPPPLGRLLPTRSAPAPLHNLLERRLQVLHLGAQSHVSVWGFSLQRLRFEVYGLGP